MKVEIHYFVEQTKVIDVDEKFEELQDVHPFSGKDLLKREIGEIAYNNIPDGAEIYAMYTDVDGENVCIY